MLACAADCSRLGHVCACTFAHTHTHRVARGHALARTRACTRTFTHAHTHAPAQRAGRRACPLQAGTPSSEPAVLLSALESRDVDLVVLAGYLKLVPEAVVRAYERRMLNVHPALLPAFGGAGMYGGRVHAAVVASGARGGMHVTTVASVARREKGALGDGHVHADRNAL